MTLSICPSCESKVEFDKFCPNCGYDASTEKHGLGPFQFLYSEIHNAYQPSNKSTKKGDRLMWMAGLFWAIIGGILLYLLHASVATLLAWAQSVAPVGPGQLIIMVIGLYLMATLFVGFLIGSAISDSSIRGKCRNGNAVRKLSRFAAFIGFGSYLLTYSLVLRGQGFNSVIDYLKLVSYLGILVLMVQIGSSDAVTKIPFCESCEDYMQKITVGYYPIRLEGFLLRMLSSRKFENFVYLHSDGYKEINGCELTLWHCKHCKSDGYVNLETTQSRYQKKEGSLTEKQQLVYSAKMERGELKTLLEIVPTIKERSGFFIIGG